MQPTRAGSLVVRTAFAALLLAVAPAFCQPPGDNALRNPSFETGEQTPDAWSFNHRRTDGEIAWDKGRARTGVASVRLTNRAEGQTGNVVQSLVLDPPLDPGSRVTFSAFAASEEATGDGPRILFNLLSTSNVRQDASAGCVGGTHDFVEVRGEALAQRPTNRLVIYLCHYGLGTAWWDDAEVTVERSKATRLVPRPQSDELLPAIRTDDGLALAFTRSGGVGAVFLDEAELRAESADSGLWLRSFGEDTVPVTGELKRQGNEVVQRFEGGDVGLRIETTFRVEDDTIHCTGHVYDLTGTDRGVDLLFALPVGGEGWRWGQSIREEMPLADEPLSVQFTTFSSVSDPKTGRGVALAVPATSPCDCEFTWDHELGYAVRFRFGLSPAASGELKSRAPFSFVLYRVDGKWGLRDAARRYYELYPEAFEKRVEREGLWMFGSPRIELPDPENYTFHEGGPKGWEYDDEHDIYTCPYLIPGQREVTRLDKLPASKQEAMDLFRAWQPPDPTRGGGWGAGVKEIIENCLLHDPRGLPQIRIRNTTWGGNSFTFPLNANPALFADADKATVAKVLLKHVAEMHEEIPNLDGTYVDSLGAWGDYLNHRREHFAFAQIPLTYDPTNGQPVIHNRFALLEFLWALRDYLHERGKLVFPNGLHQNRRFHFFAADVMGVEGHGYLEQKRAMAYQKPFLLLIYNIHTDPVQMEHYYHLCTFYGIYPSFANMRVYETPERYAPVAKLNNRFVPALRKITKAGWQPLTHARSSDPEVWVERWGPDEKGSVFLTAYNAGAEDRQCSIDIAARELGIDENALTAQDMLRGEEWASPNREGVNSLKLTIPAESVRVLALSGE